jgi:hypothetical protein
MWLFTRYGFYSVASAQKKNGAADPVKMMVRARCVAHLEQLKVRFPDLAGEEIVTLPGHDYGWRIFVSKDRWCRIVAELAHEQEWSNFKSEAARFQGQKGSAYVHALHDIWGVMMKLQQDSFMESINGSRSVLDEPHLPDLIWDGITTPGIVSDEDEKLRQHLSDAAKNYEWPSVLAILSEHPELVNTTRPGGHSWYTPLHQAAHGGASEEVVLDLLRIGAWRSLRNSKGDRPVDIARSKSRVNLLEMLEPVYSRDVPPSVLARIQGHFHEVIRGRANRLVEENRLRLPELEPVLEFRPRQFWFTVPGMCGGFGYWLEQDGANAKIVTESWSRVQGGSGQRHEITVAGSVLVAEGFV